MKECQVVTLNGLSTKCTPVIHYKATAKDSRGLFLSEPIVMMSIKHAGVQSPWVAIDGLPPEDKDRLIANVDRDFIPNPWEHQGVLNDF